MLSVRLLVVQFFLLLLLSLWVMSDSCCPMGCSLPSSSVHGIFQARILEWVAISFSRGSSQPRDQTPVSCIAGGVFIIWATRETPLSNQYHWNSVLLEIPAFKKMWAWLQQSFWDYLPLVFSIRGSSLLSSDPSLNSERPVWKSRSKLRAPLRAGRNTDYCALFTWRWAPHHDGCCELLNRVCGGDQNWLAVAFCLLAKENSFFKNQQ